MPFNRKLLKMPLIYKGEYMVSKTIGNLVEACHTSYVQFRKDYNSKQDEISKAANEALQGKEKEISQERCSIDKLILNVKVITIGLGAVSGLYLTFFALPALFTSGSVYKLILSIGTLVTSHELYCIVDNVSKLKLKKFEVDIKNIGMVAKIIAFGTQIFKTLLEELHTNIENEIKKISEERVLSQIEEDGPSNQEQLRILVNQAQDQMPQIIEEATAIQIAACVKKIFNGCYFEDAIAYFSRVKFKELQKSEGY